MALSAVVCWVFVDARSACSTNEAAAVWLVVGANNLMSWPISRSRYLEEQWFVGFRRIEQNPGSTRQFTIVQSPNEHTYADPFIVEKNGRHFLFVEDYCSTIRRGVISFVELQDHAPVGNAEAILTRDYHMSYPCVFEWHDQMYMIPETRGHHSIEVYRATAFPRGWVFAGQLMSDVSAVDPTLIQCRGKLWLFFGVGENGISERDLHLYFSDDLFGPWRSHPRNPVVSDRSRARPAGQIRMIAGRLIRPGQDCSLMYGGAITLSEIDILSEQEYHESVVAKITPAGWVGCRGTHTFNEDCGYQVIDGKLLRLPLTTPSSIKVRIQSLASPSVFQHGAWSTRTK